MPHIIREDGERFVIPSYRDVISAKKTALLKKEILLLSASHGEYTCLHKKNIEQYEVAFSPEPGFLLGETAWSYFKRPLDLIYCEAIPNTSEAILVIVKGGSVYLDGSFPLDAIAEELVIFRTQQNNFDIYIYGDVPISEAIAEDKFTLHSSSVKSFNILPEPVFPTLPTIKRFQLQKLDIALKAQGIGVFPFTPIIATLVILGLGWMAWDYLRLHEKQIPSFVTNVVNPYQLYLDSLSTPEPADEISEVVNKFLLISTVPGWYPDTIEYNSPKFSAHMKSSGVRTDVLFDWAKANDMAINLEQTGFYLAATQSLPNRQPPVGIHSTKEVIATILDRLSYILPGNKLAMGAATDRGRFMETLLTINFTNISPTTLSLLAQQLKDLPLGAPQVKIKMENGSLTGTISLKALGN
jgi:hypothetical protein